VDRRSADDAAEHVAPRLGAWEDAVGDQERGGADVIGEDVQAGRAGG